MELEDQTCTYEQSKKIVELGVVLDTYFVYRYGKVITKHDALVDTAKIKDYLDYIIPAPNVAELGVLLELYAVIPFPYGDAIEYVMKNNGKRIVGINNAKTEAQVRCEALIWLIENDFVKVGDLKL